MRVLVSALSVSTLLLAEASSLPSAERPEPSLFTMSAAPDLGTLDVAYPIRGSVYVMNTGAAPRRIQPPHDPGISRLRVIYPKVLEIPPKGSIEIRWEYDGHGDAGPSTIKVQVKTDDPGARVVEETYTYRATQTTRVSPFRSSVSAQRTPEGVKSAALRWEFVGAANEVFVGFEVEDPDAPLTGDFVQTPGGGLLGTLVVDGYRVEKGAKPYGETRVLGLTNRGVRDYFWVQWTVR